MNPLFGLFLLHRGYTDKDIQRITDALYRVYQRSYPVHYELNENTSLSKKIEIANLRYWYWSSKPIPAGENDEEKLAIRLYRKYLICTPEESGLAEQPDKEKFIPLGMDQYNKMLRLHPNPMMLRDLLITDIHDQTAWTLKEIANMSVVIYEERSSRKSSGMEQPDPNDPISLTAYRFLQRYIQEDRRCPARVKALFVSKTGKVMAKGHLSYIINRTRRLLQEADLKNK